MGGQRELGRLGVIWKLELLAMIAPKPLIVFRPLKYRLFVSIERSGAFDWWYFSLNILFQDHLSATQEDWS